jgi:hypothetical protein
MATTQPVLQGAAAGPIVSWSKGRLIAIPATINMANPYTAGGEPVTQPSDAKGMKLVGLIVLTPVPAVADRIFSWNGSTTSPKIIAMVMSTGVELGAVNLSGVTLNVLFLYRV